MRRVLSRTPNLGRSFSLYTRKWEGGYLVECKVIYEDNFIMIYIKDKHMHGKTRIKFGHQEVCSCRCKVGLKLHSFESLHYFEIDISDKRL